MDLLSPINGEEDVHSGDPRARILFPIEIDARARVFFLTVFWIKKTRKKTEKKTDAWDGEPDPYFPFFLCFSGSPAHISPFPIFNLCPLVFFPLFSKKKKGKKTRDKNVEDKVEISSVLSSFWL